MTIPKPSETKQPIMRYLAQSKEPARIAYITELMGIHFKLSKKEIAEQMPKGGRRFATKIGVAIDEMKAKGLVRSTGRGYVEITQQGRERLQVGGMMDGRRKAGRPPKARPATQRSATKQPSITPIKRDEKLVQRATDIVISYFGRNTVSPQQIPGIIESTYAALSGLGIPSTSSASRKTVGK